MRSIFSPKKISSREYTQDSITSQSAPKKRFVARPNVLVAIVLLVLATIGGYIIWNTYKQATPVVRTDSANKVRIGISMDTIKELRWSKDIQYLKEAAAELGATTTVLVADGNDDLQVSQIENLTSQKVDVLIVVPHDPAAVASALTAAHNAGIQVLSYDRLAVGSTIDLYVSFNNEKVGANAAQYVIDSLKEDGKTKKIAFVGGAPTDSNAAQIKAGVMSVLQPLIDSRDITLVYDKPTDNWEPDVAYENFKAFLDKGYTVDGVIAANDATAFGAIEALETIGLAGKVPVSGQDADLPALRRIVQGTQTMTNYKPIKDLAYQAIKMAINLSNNTPLLTNAEIANGTTRVAAYLIDPIPVTKDTIMQTVVADGFLKEEDIYQN